jgi:hypothetical protein
MPKGRGLFRSPVICLLTSTGDALSAGRSSTRPDHFWSIRSRSVIDGGFWRVSLDD